MLVVPTKYTHTHRYTTKHSQNLTSIFFKHRLHGDGHFPGFLHLSWFPEVDAAVVSCARDVEVDVALLAVGILGYMVERLLHLAQYQCD